jgi:hypothetical protein
MQPIKFSLCKGDFEVWDGRNIIHCVGFVGVSLHQAALFAQIVQGATAAIAAIVIVVVIIVIVVVVLVVVVIAASDEPKESTRAFLFL